MKKIFLILITISLTFKVFADDVTAIITNSGIGLSNGSISLTLTAGYAPYTFNWTGPDGFTSSEQKFSLQPC